MTKLFSTIALLTLGWSVNAQYMIVGKDSISLTEFKKEYQYGLQNNGVESTIRATKDFLLLQQFAAEQKAETTASFREKMMEKEAELLQQNFYPKQVIDPVLSEFIKDNQTEKEVQIFLVAKTEGDQNNYQQIYNEVKSGKLTMEEALTKYTKSSPKPLFIKPGSVDSGLYRELKTLAPNTYTSFVNKPGYVAFGKVLSSRPSLGYLIFGTVSYPNDANAEVNKNKIYTDLKAGKSFQEVAKLYGSTQNEKEKGGIVMGSPTLPNEVYNLFKGQKKGYYTPEPILLGENYFVFNIYNVEPYTLTANNRDFFIRELNSSLYSENLQDAMLAYLKSDPSYQETPDFNLIKKSYRNLETAKDNTLLYQFKNKKIAAKDLRDAIGENKAQAEKLTPALWEEAVVDLNSRHLMSIYTANLVNRPEVKKEINDFRKGLYSDYVFSKYLTQEIAKNPQWLANYYQSNKAKYMWGKRAQGRVAIIADDKLASQIEKEMKNTSNWKSLNEKYYGKLNEEKQIVVHFEEGEMSEDADVFTKYKVPFKPGIHQTKMEKRTLVIAIDKILPPSQMTQDEASEMLKEAVTEQKLREIIAQQEAKTPITLQPGFIADLEKNFKK